MILKETTAKTGVDTVSLFRRVVCPVKMAGLLIFTCGLGVQDVYAESGFENSYNVNRVQQGRKVVGEVVDIKGEPLIGVNVAVKGQTIGTIADLNGQFTLEIPTDNVTLVFSYIGYVSLELKPSDTPMKVMLREDTQNLDEVIVVGYGTQKKSDLTGAITRVDAEDFKTTPVTGVETALQGRAAGVQVTSFSGSPGSGTSVRIRGIGTVNNANEPLYVVDGIPVGGINYLNPSDISSIEILKDASATAIYGSRASNGVVLITTKRGNSEGEVTKTSVTFDMYYGISQAMNQPDMLDAAGFMELNRRAYLSNPDGLHTDFRDPEKMLGVVEKATGSRSGTNWWDECMQNGSVQNYNVSVSGGNKVISHMTSASYYKNEGIVKFSDFDRITARSNTDVRVNSRIKLASNIGITHERRHRIPENDLENGTIFNALLYDPTTPVWRGGYEGIPGWEDRLEGYDKDDIFTQFGTSKYSNKRQPYAQAYRNGNCNEWTELKVVGNIVLDIKIMDWLTFKSNFGLDLSRRNDMNFTPKYYLDPDEKEGNNTVYNRNDKDNNWVWENTLNFNKTFGKHALSAVAGVTMEQWTYAGFEASKQGTPNNSEDQWVLESATTNPGTTGWRRHRSMLSYLARVNYGFDDRFLITASVRSDGSSKFLKENRWATFPSASAGWRISQEKFFTEWDQNFWSNLKLRVGWGQIGNQLPVGEADYVNKIIGNDAMKYVFGANKEQQIGYAIDGFGNPRIQWETSEQTNFGLDLGFFDGKLTATMDYFIKNTRDMLIRVPLPMYVGYNNDPWANQGSVRNSGFEMQLDWQDQIGDFTYGISGNLTHMKNEVTSLGDGGPMPGGNERIGDVSLTREGWPIGSFYGWEMIGVFQSEEEIIKSHMKDNNPRPGDLIYADANNDGKLTDDDRVNLGSPFPSLMYGFTLNAAYKGFDLTAFFQGVSGNKIFRMLKYYSHQKTGYFNSPANILDVAWRAPGTLGADDPGNASNSEYQISSDPRLNTKASSYYVENGSYLRLKNFQVGYTFPEKWMSKAKINRLRVYFGVQNMFTITAYNGLDPELAGNDNDDPTNFGIDRSNYPQPRTYMFGLNLGF